MAELLNESEARVHLLLEQERVLKEEIRKVDRVDRRQNLNIEYLKNVVLKFLESPGERENLATIISNILQLSPSENDA
ncbi:hypothetical protein M427DRAFT_428667 [Gonapodya prolifera JEL478]|uniref:GRIP domain-containing protein n=1 Tax=Gonapodya prolifera (strain JEL478) TaxID=1344416 RepID=A0A139ASM2_GONPJ|nr:hypothetical protein M427DRAFT_428667 [Gonapodya prolifera JEL478]|eukprot:KXS19742.1 hypothetical protein M427DRAFT_428667 [Gonapodya prolifera JEL478]